MAKIICNNAKEMKVCDFNSLFDESVQVFICPDTCPVCQGKGYTEADVVAVGAIRQKIQDEVGMGRSAVLVLSELLKEVTE